MLVVLLAACFLGSRVLKAWKWRGSERPRQAPITAQHTPPVPAAKPAVSMVPTPSAEPTTALGPPAPSGPSTISVAAVGDILFDRRVEAFIARAGGRAPFEAVAPRLSAADVTVGNLESMIGTTGKAVANKQYTFRGDPRGIEGLKYAGFDVVSLANNHTLDYGSEPLSETIGALDAAGIAHAGAGPNAREAWKPATIVRPRAKIAYLAFTHTLPPGFMAGPNRWGVAFGRHDPAAFERAVRSASKTHDYVIVSFHWGVELSDDANPEQVRWGRRAIDAGADMVLAHHPHVIQGVEFYKQGMIAYSLGDFVWDHSRPKTGETMIVEANMGPKGVTDVVAYPIFIQQSTGKPEYASPTMSKTILDRLAKISRKLGTVVDIDGGKASLTPAVR